MSINNKLEYAESINGVFKAFEDMPLREEELEKFFVKTMQFRTGNIAKQPIKNIRARCKIPSERNSFLILGHKGCGKSTELINLSHSLKKEDGYIVKIIECRRDLDLGSFNHADLMILASEAIINIADENNCPLSDELKNRILNFWKGTIEIEQVIEKNSFVSYGGEVKAKTPNWLPIVNIGTECKMGIKYNTPGRMIYREKISARPSEWTNMINEIVDEITKKCGGKQPILIFEDLDKIDQEKAWEVFGGYSKTLTDIKTPMIYTFPIALCYSPKFTALQGYFQIEKLPMIKLKTINGEEVKEGFETIKEIVSRRISPDLFEGNSLNEMIYKTGGSLRDLFHVIISAADMAENRSEIDGVSKILEDDAKLALIELRSDLTRRIERKNYNFLLDIIGGNRQNIEDKEMLLEMMQAGVVLEYNGDHWHNVHPLITEFLEEQTKLGFIKREDLL